VKLATLLVQQVQPSSPRQTAQPSQLVQPNQPVQQNQQLVPNSLKQQEQTAQPNQPLVQLVLLCLTQHSRPGQVVHLPGPWVGWGLPGRPARVRRSHYLSSTLEMREPTMNRYQ
jgi:hypothetical protein